VVAAFEPVAEFLGIIGHFEDRPSEIWIEPRQLVLSMITSELVVARSLIA
jgi:hypothetical protein